MVLNWCDAAQRLWRGMRCGARPSGQIDGGVTYFICCICVRTCGRAILSLSRAYRTYRQPGRKRKHRIQQQLLALVARYKGAMCAWTALLDDSFCVVLVTCATRMCDGGRSGGAKRTAFMRAPYMRACLCCSSACDAKAAGLLRGQLLGG